MIVGCYSVHLYCDSGGHDGFTGHDGAYVVKNGPEWHNTVTIANEFAGRNERECLTQARSIGWIIRSPRRKPRVAVCPVCAKRLGLKP